ncbi:GMC oxidoreductase [Aestuariibius insulae]|uniref:GMC oxidoreductase n=1 Tax=Aestuariibius insulae TaxID=2058287 RepID=UPI00345ED852
MNRIEIASATSRQWDVVIAGSSFATLFFAYALRERGLQILFVERGPFIDRQTQLDRRFHDKPAPVRQDNRSGHRKDWTIRHQVGGGSNCWWGNTPRFHPSDLELKTRYGIAQDWPISYDTLEPYLLRTEEIMEIAGDSETSFTPRSAPYPYPAPILSRADRKLGEGNLGWQAMPSARSNGGRRPTCCASGACTLCPVDAKFTILNALEEMTDDGFHLLTDTELRTVETSAGEATGALVRTGDGAEHRIDADLVALAANPIGTSAILLRSELGGEHVGKGIHEQVGQFAWLDIPFDNYYGGSSFTGLGYGFYDGPFRSEAASVLIESWNAPPSLRLEPGKWLQRLKLKFVAEDLPQDRNRIILENDEPTLVWHGHTDYALAGLARAVDNLSDIIPFDYEVSRIGDLEPTEAHVIGGTPMGKDPVTSVVDPLGRVHGISNLLCLGASTFPTGAAANPTLTLSALSLRSGDLL